VTTAVRPSGRPSAAVTNPGEPAAPACPGRPWLDPATGLRSALYEGRVGHARRGPVTHAFQQWGAWFLFDLDELAEIDGRLRLLSVDRPNVVSLRAADHFDDDGRSLGEKVRSCCADAGVVLPADGRIVGLTQARVGGYVFNPVSYWWCLGSDGRVAAVVAEINNTFGERLPQVLVGPGPVYEHRKDLHVSPFLGMDVSYRYDLPVPSDRLSVRMDVLDPDGTVRLVATLRAQRRPLTDRTLASFLVRHPMMPLQVTAGIHRQALRLWRKGVPFHHKPAFEPGKGSSHP